MEMTPIQQIAYGAVAEIQDMKRVGGKSPDFATIDEIVNYMREELLEALDGQWHPNVRNNGVRYGNKRQSSLFL